MWVSRIVVEIYTLSVSETSAMSNEPCHQAVFNSSFSSGTPRAQNPTLNQTFLIDFACFSSVSPESYLDF